MVYVIFDGTSHFIGDLDDLRSDEYYENCGEFENEDDASGVVDRLNEECTDRYK